MLNADLQLPGLHTARVGHEVKGRKTDIRGLTPGAATALLRAFTGRVPETSMFFIPRTISLSCACEGHMGSL